MYLTDKPVLDQVFYYQLRIREIQNVTLNLGFCAIKNGVVTKFYLEKNTMYSPLNPGQYYNPVLSKRDIRYQVRVNFKERIVEWKMVYPTESVLERRELEPTISSMDIYPSIVILG